MQRFCAVSTTACVSYSGFCIITTTDGAWPWQLARAGSALGMSIIRMLATHRPVQSTGQGPLNSAWHWGRHKILQQNLKPQSQSAVILPNPNGERCEGEKWGRPLHDGKARALREEVRDLIVPRPGLVPTPWHGTCTAAQLQLGLVATCTIQH